MELRVYFDHSKKEKLDTSLVNTTNSSSDACMTKSNKFSLTEKASSWNWEVLQNKFFDKDMMLNWSALKPTGKSNDNQKKKTTSIPR